MAAANLPGNLASAWLLDRVGRRAVLAWSMLLAAACAVGFGYSSGGGESAHSGAALTVALDARFASLTSACVARPYASRRKSCVALIARGSAGPNAPNAPAMRDGCVSH